MTETSDVNIPNVIATKIDRTHIYYECPCCRTKYKKNGDPTARSKPVIHKHGSSGSLANRLEHRSHHKVWNFPTNQDTYSSCNIIINDNTIREV